MAVDPSKIFAVSVGINDYQSNGAEGPRNLLGCLNDVLIVKNILQLILHVPAANIKTLTSPATSAGDDLPTKENFLKVVRNVAEAAVEKTGSDGLLFLHYSGHGGRKRTQYPDKMKKGMYFDELLLTLEGHITDVEFGDLIEEVAQKGLQVFVVLDCCHSGSADRCGDMESDNMAVRCWSSGSAPTIAANRGTRNVAVQESHFSQKRNHNLLAACQPHEFAREYRNRNGEFSPCGVLTYHLDRAFRELARADAPVTYGDLVEHLQSLCLRSTKQKPLHVGDRSRIIFGKHSRSSQGRAGSLRAKVIKVNGSRVVLNKGAAHGVQSRDVFSIYLPTQFLFGFPTPSARPLAEVCVDDLKGLRARATVLWNDTDNPGTLKVGLCAEAKRRNDLPDVHFKIPATSEDQPRNHDIIKLERSWNEASGLSQPPVNLKTSSESTLTPPAILVMQIEEINENGTTLQTLQFFDVNGIHLANIPTLCIDDPLVGQKLVQLLPHLCSYQRLATLTSNAPKPKDYEFSVQELPMEFDQGGGDSGDSEFEDNSDLDYAELGDDLDLDYTKSGDNLDLDGSDSVDVKCFSRHELHFENLSHSTQYYVTIFNLTPTYGITQLFPQDGGDSFAVERQSCIPETRIDIFAPELIKRRAASASPGFEMRDIIKVIITGTTTNFEHYVQPGLKDWDDQEADIDIGAERNNEGSYELSKNQRDAKPAESKKPVPTCNDFWVESKEIYTKVN
ncbi:caspase domain-containing protein [Xylaria intraflava]|nr:caspase domain-containing protein [Xylaria intraflava]